MLGQKLIEKISRDHSLELIATSLGNCVVNSDNLKYYPLDVTDSKSTIATVEKIERELGQIELTVLNAGTFFPMPVEEHPPTVRIFLIPKHR